MAASTPRWPAGRRERRGFAPPGPRLGSGHRGSRGLCFGRSLGGGLRRTAGVAAGFGWGAGGENLLHRGDRGLLLGDLIGHLDLGRRAAKPQKSIPRPLQDLHGNTVPSSPSWARAFCMAASSDLPVASIHFNIRLVSPYFSSLSCSGSSRKDSSTKPSSSSGTGAGWGTGFSGAADVGAAEGFSSWAAWAGFSVLVG